MFISFTDSAFLILGEKRIDRGWETGRRKNADGTEEDEIRLVSLTTEEMTTLDRPQKKRPQKKRPQEKGEQKRRGRNRGYKD